MVATFFLMYVSGISLNIMSLGGLTLGIGLLVDNAIVVLESIQRQRDDGLPLEEAARRGAGEVSRAVVASTLTPPTTSCDRAVRGASSPKTPSRCIAMPPWLPQRAACPPEEGTNMANGQRHHFTR